MNIQASDSNNRSTIITTFPAMAQSSQDVEELKALRKQVDLKKAIVEQLSKHLPPASSSLANKFKMISLNTKFFDDESLKDFTNRKFDNISIQFIRMIIDDNYFPMYKPKLPSIFNQYFSSDLLLRHLNNLLEYSDALKLKDTVHSKAIHEQLTYLCLDKLMLAVGYSKNDFWLSLETANLYQDLTEDPLAVQFEKKQGELKSKWGAFIESFWDEQKNLLVSEEMLSTQTPTSIFEAQSIYLAYVARYQMAAMVGATVTSALPPPVKFLGAGALALPSLSSIARKIYLRWMRTAPIAVPPLTDYSKKYQNSFSSSFIGREDIFQNILRIWQQNKHPILVGEPGVGKTTIIMELGRRVAMGEIKELKGKTLFAGSAALINEPDMMGASAFPRVIKTLNAYRDNVILALDEAHALASNKNNLTLLRSTTDNSTESLRYCLFATTPDGYESFEKDESLRRRIVKIDVPSLSKEEMIYFLHEEAKLISPLLTVDSKAMEILYEKSKGGQNETRQLLHKLLSSVESRNMSYPLIKKRDQKAFQVQLLLTQYRNHHTEITSEAEIAQSIKKGNLELDELNRQCLKEKEIRDEHIYLMERLVNSKEKRLFLSKKLYRSIDSEAKKLGNSLNSFDYFDDKNFIKEYEAELKEIIFLQYVDIPYQIKYLKKFEELHGLISRIDDHNLADFIDNTSLKPFQPMEVESSLTQNLEQISNTMIQDSETKD